METQNFSTETVKRQTKSIDDEIIGLEYQYWQALIEHDVRTMQNLSDDICLIAGPQGFSRVDKQSFQEMMDSANYTLHHFEIDDYQVRQLNEETAVVVYKVREDLTVDNQSLSLEAAESSTWIRRDGRWVCAQHSEALIGDPFGRDRVHSAKGM